MITLLTDYGHADEFVGVLHGVIARAAPGVPVIDVSHGIAACDVAGGALVLARAVPYLPVGVHVAVVDPGVGSTRRAVAVRAGDGRVFVGPDNGLLWPALQGSGGALQAVEISDSPACLRPISGTFHGRDIFAPVAAALALGGDLETLGVALDVVLLERLPEPLSEVRDGVLRSEVIGIDGFGNVELAARAADLAALVPALGADVQVRTGGHEVHVGRLLATFADAASGELAVYEDSGLRLALAFPRESAAARLGVTRGDVVELSGGDCHLL